MPSIIHVPNFRDGYVDVVRQVRDQGIPTAPRGIRTRELLDVIIVLDDPTDALPIGVGRKAHIGIGVVEALQLIAGVSDPGLTVRVAPNMQQFMDGNVFHGAYGSRIGDQMESVSAKLREDPDSRQALVTLWDPTRDNIPGKRDYPCTTMLQFLIRDDRLIMHTTMRSNDVWWGLAYDAFQFTQLQLTLARVLGIETGAYHHHAVSLHMYERDFEASESLTYAWSESRPKFFGIGDVRCTMRSMRERAQTIMSGDVPRFATQTERMYLDAIST